MKKFMLLILCLVMAGCVTYTPDINGNKDINRDRKQHDEPKVPEPRLNK